MSGNSFGVLYCVTSFGESHGPAYGGVVDGCPPGLELSAADLQRELDRRKPGSSRHVTQRRETDTVEILSGVFEGRTTGTPIGFLVRNEDARSKDYADIARKFRPGHADYTYWQKYGVRDPRGGGRASARETLVRVAAGAIAKKWLAARYGVQVRGYLAQLGPHRIALRDWSAVGSNPFFAADPGAVEALEAYMDELRARGDSCGARVNVVASGVPVGWGEPVYGRLDADIAAAMMSINAVKGVEIGAGFAAVAQKGSEHGDEMTPAGFASNHNGGVLGGISTGQHPHSAAHDRRRRAGGDHRDHRPPRPLRRHPRDADRRGDARLRADGPRAAPPRAVRRRLAADAPGIENPNGINYSSDSRTQGPTT
jgi:chorismate synthase